MLFQQCAASTYSNDLQLKNSLFFKLESVLSSAENALQILEPFRYEEDAEYLRQISATVVGSSCRKLPTCTRLRALLALAHCSRTVNDSTTFNCSMFCMT